MSAFSASLFTIFQLWGFNAKKVLWGTDYSVTVTKMVISCCVCVCVRASWSIICAAQRWGQGSVYLKFASSLSDSEFIISAPDFYISLDLSSWTNLTTIHKY